MAIRLKRRIKSHHTGLIWKATELAFCSGIWVKVYV